MKEWFKDIIDWFERRLLNIRYFFFHVKRGFQFMKFGWKDYDWDFYYVLRAEEFKLKQLQHYFEHSEISENDERTAKEIKLALSLLKIIMGDDSFIEFIDDDVRHIKLTGYVNTSTANKYLNEEACKIINGDNEFLRLHMTDELRVEKAWHCYNELRRIYLRNWWN